MGEQAGQLSEAELGLKTNREILAKEAKNICSFYNIPKEIKEQGGGNFFSFISD